MFSTFRILLFFIGIAGSAAAAEDEPDVEMPAVEWLVAPIRKYQNNFKRLFSEINFRHIVLGHLKS